MGKVISSPVERFPGTVTLHDPLNYEKYQVWERSVKEAQAVKLTGDFTRAELDAPLIPGICACVEKWDLENFPKNVGVDNFPATPALASARLLLWVVEEILKIVKGDEDPNE
jgi:hypothetical protein